jgi:CRP/FNR family cyclic AMP-dependent transcriptional regulator
MSERTLSLLARIDLFSELAPDELGQIAELAEERALSRDTVVFSAGDNAETMFVVARGKVKIVVTSPDGKDLILAVLGPGQVFGEMALLDSAPRSATVITETSVDLVVIHREEFQRLLGGAPRIAHRLLAILSQRLRRANAAMQSLAYVDVAGRLARYFLTLARDHGQRLGNGWVVVRRPTQADIAHSIGTSRETVSRLMKEFEESFGLVHKGKFTYLREDLLD